jgi:tetratricopeptide (TPR) repeat protein
VVRRLIGTALILAVACTAGFSRAALDRLVGEASAGEELLYLPNGKYLKILSMGHSNVLADMIYLWSIQYYSNYERAQRHRYVEHVFSEVITELDPRYIDAYWLGALILILEIGDFDAGRKLLDKGIERNPEKWILPHLAAWECYHAKRPELAAEYFEKAASIEGAPTVVRRMRAGLIARGGDVEVALEMWQAIRDDPSSDSLSVKIAVRKVRELEARRAVAMLEGIVARFRDDNGRWPRRLEELVRRSYIRDLPRDPDGRAYEYDAATGRVSTPAGTALGGI